MGRKLQLFACFVARQHQPGIFREAKVEFIGFSRRSGMWGAEPHRGGSLAEADPSQW